jgi:lipopolysaccharide export system permease protein
MLSRVFRPLDRYVFSEFWKIFVVTALGFPVLVIVIDLTDNLEKYLDRGLPTLDIVMSYVFWLPESMFLILPAAVLFATVFSIGNLTRHSEITAAKASGISFFRMVAPIFVGATLAAGIDLVLAEAIPATNSRRIDLLEGARFRVDSLRFNFAHAGEHGRVYKAGQLDRVLGQIQQLQIERKGVGPEYPTYVLTATSADWEGGSWTLREGVMHVLPDSATDLVLTYESAVDRLLVERPSDLLAKPRSPQEMRFREMGRFITALERSGGDANVLRVERALKIAIPITCIVIALFGAPLATSTQRGGTTFGVGVSLATTVVFLILIQLTKAIGGKALVDPDMAAWIPNAVFALLGLGLLSRVRT